MRILFVSSWYPFPPDNGSKLRIYHLLRGLAAQHDVTLLSFVDGDGPAEPPAPLRAICQEVQTVRQRPYHPRSGRSLLGLLSPTPRVIIDTFAPEMRDRIRRELDRAPYDLVVASQWSTAAYLAGIHGVPAIFEEIEVGVLETKRAAAPTPVGRIRHALTLLKLRYYLRRLLPRFAAATVVSPVEASLLRRLVPTYDRVEVVPNAVDVASYAEVPAVPRPNSLIFAGSLSYFANRDAMEWFLAEVYPSVRARVPDVQLTITGDPGDRALPSALGVRMTGFVEDVRPLIASSSVSLAPIRLGGGTRLKILEAMALRSAVVSTTKGAEGLDVGDGEHLLLADSPRAYADAVVRALTDPSLRDRIARGGHELVTQRYDWCSVLPLFLHLVDRAAREGPA